VLFTKNLCFKIKQLINSSIVRSLNDSEKGFVSGQRLRTLRCCITTTLRHTAISVNKFLTKKGIPVVPQPPYSPYQSLCDFILPKLKFYLKGTVDNIQKIVTQQLGVLPHEDFQHCYREWEKHLRRFVASQGNYFEVDNVVFNKKTLQHQSHYFLDTSCTTMISTCLQQN
jgi:hypothetical protein